MLHSKFASAWQVLSCKCNWWRLDDMKNELNTPKWSSDVMTLVHV